MKRSVIAGLIAVLLSSAAWGQEKLLLSGKDITNEQLAEKVKGLTKLKWLDLRFTPITDAGLIHLKGLKRLEKLDLHKTQITDLGLVHLKDLTGSLRRFSSLGYWIHAANLHAPIQNSSLQLG